MTRHPSAGFTLVELMVALLIAGLVLLLSRQLFTVVIDGARAIRASRFALDRRVNAQRWLASTWLSLDVGEEAGGFEGHEAEVAFAAWTPVPGGWFERDRIRLAVRDTRLVADIGGRPLILADSVDAVSFDYLLVPGADSKWVHNWVSPVSAPLAVRLRVRRNGCPGQCVDTLLFQIGPRG